MRPLADRLARTNFYRRVYLFVYNSWYDPRVVASWLRTELTEEMLLGEHAPPGSRRLDFIAHSMGGVVARCAIELQSDGDVRQATSALVTLGTPHTGTGAGWIAVYNEGSTQLRPGSATMDALNGRHYHADRVHLRYYTIAGTTPGPVEVGDGVVGLFSAHGHDHYRAGLSTLIYDHLADEALHDVLLTYPDTRHEELPAKGSVHDAVEQALVRARAEPDIVMGQFRAGYYTVPAGQYIDFTVHVKNTGPIAITRPFWVDLYRNRSAEPKRGGDADDWKMVDGLPPNATKSVTFRAAFSSNSQIWVRADGHDLVQERKEANNVATCFVRVGGRPGDAVTPPQGGTPDSGPPPNVAPPADAVVTTIVPETAWARDSSARGFWRYGGGWQDGAAGADNHMYFVANRSMGEGFTTGGVWRPDLPHEGQWEVFAHVPNNNATTTAARYEVHHADGQNDRIVRQSDYFNQWVSLGTYRFTGGSNEFVALWSNTTESSGSSLVGYDTVKWEFRGYDAPVMDDTDYLIRESDVTTTWGGFGFYKGSTSGTAAGYWNDNPAGLDSHCYYVLNEDEGHPDKNYGKWTPNLPYSGMWEIYVWIPAKGRDGPPERITNHAFYEMHSAIGQTKIEVNQEAHGDRWVSLGTYRFNAGGDGYLALWDTTGELRRSRLVVYDTARWKYRGPGDNPPHVAAWDRIGPRLLRTGTTQVRIQMDDLDGTNDVREVKLYFVDPHRNGAWGDWSKLGEVQGNDMTVTINADDTGRFWDGDYSTLVVEAWDKEGHYYLEQRAGPGFVIDRTPPRPVLLGGTPQYARSSVTVRGQVEDLTDVTELSLGMRDPWRGGGIRYFHTAQHTKTTEVNLSLVPGYDAKFPLVMLARDEAGNALIDWGGDEQFFVQDMQSPQLTSAELATARVGRGERARLRYAFFGCELRLR